MKNLLLLIVIALISCEEPERTKQQIAEETIKQYEDKKEFEYDGGSINWGAAKFTALRVDTVKFDQTAVSNNLLDSIIKHNDRIRRGREESIAVADSLRATLDEAERSFKPVVGYRVSYEFRNITMATYILDTAQYKILYKRSAFGYYEPVH